MIQAPRLAPCPSAYILFQSTHKSSRNSRFAKLKNPSAYIHWAEISGWFLMRIQVPRSNPGDRIYAIPDLQQAHLCFKVLSTPRPNGHEKIRVLSVN